MYTTTYFVTTPGTYTLDLAVYLVNFHGLQEMSHPQSIMGKPKPLPSWACDGTPSFLLSDLAVTFTHAAAVGTRVPGHYRNEASWREYAHTNNSVAAVDVDHDPTANPDLLVCTVHHPSARWVHRDFVPPNVKSVDWQPPIFAGMHTGEESRNKAAAVDIATVRVNVNEYRFLPDPRECSYAPFMLKSFNSSSRTRVCCCSATRSVDKCCAN